MAPISTTETQRSTEAAQRDLNNPHPVSFLCWQRLSVIYVADFFRTLFSRHVLNKEMIRTRTLLIVVLGLSVPLSALAQSSKPSKSSQSTAAIRAVMDAQRDAWNRGDIEGYMDGYERSEKTVFISGDNVTRGWQTVLERYRKSYDTREKMGVLTFSDLEITLLGNDSASVLGRWSLKRANDEPHGRFTLIFKRTSKGWRIVHDHTS